jgi:hypothetical protein
LPVLSKETAQTRTLHRALEIAGTPERLAEMLGAPAADLPDWLSGERATPNEIYLRALDLVSRGPHHKPGRRK